MTFVSFVFTPVRQGLGPLKDSPEHFLAQLACIRVLHRGVIGAQQNDSIGQLVLNAVSELIRSTGADHSSTTKMVEVGVKADFAQGDDDFQIL